MVPCNIPPDPVTDRTGVPDRGVQDSRVVIVLLFSVGLLLSMAMFCLFNCGASISTSAQSRGALGPSSDEAITCPSLNTDANEAEITDAEPLCHIDVPLGSIGVSGPSKAPDTFAIGTVGALSSSRKRSAGKGNRV